MSSASGSWPRRVGVRFPNAARRHSGRPTIQSRSVRSPAARVGVPFGRSRRVPAHAWHYRNAAVMIEAGIWRRPQYYPGAGEGLDEAYVREAAIVRERVGLADVSSLGKIAVQGPDVGQFLDHVYVNTFSTLPVGRARYGVMLRDDGLVLDDGTTWRMAEQDWFMTTTTAQSARVMALLEGLLATRFQNPSGSLDVGYRSMVGSRGSGPSRARSAGGRCGWRRHV